MQKPRNISNSPGVYRFIDEHGTVLYIGKAKNLKNRVESYFSTNLLPKTEQMVTLANSIEYIKVTSEFEALLLEANLIKKYKPKYNVALKDDKSPLYIGITKDEYPRIVSFRKPELAELKLKEYFGPYLSGFSAMRVLKIIHKIFPYSQHLPSAKICIYKQLGLCNPCPSEIAREKDPQKKKELRERYLRNIQNVKRILNGKFTTLQKDLEKELKRYSKEERFEEAKIVSEQLGMFKRISETPDYDIEEYLQNPNLAEDIYHQESVELKRVLKDHFPELNEIHRIECFDIAHLSGSFPTASMVTFIDGEADKRFYRHFKIYQNKKNSDVDSMREVIKRRLKHLDPPAGGWGRPNLIIIDGGKPQLSKVHDLLEEAGIPFIGLAKRLETIVIWKNGAFVEIRAEGNYLKLLQRIRDEAHRFARRLHHKHFRDNMKL